MSKKNTPKYFILLRDNEGRIQKSYLAKFKSSEPESFKAIYGSLYKERDDKLPNNSSIFGLVSLTDNSWLLDVTASDVMELNERETNLLKAVSSNLNRYVIITTKQKELRKACCAKINDCVNVLTDHGEEVLGVIQNIGEVKDKDGIYFTVEMFKPKKTVTLSFDEITFIEEVERKITIKEDMEQKKHFFMLKKTWHGSKEASSNIVEKGALCFECLDSVQSNMMKLRVCFSEECITVPLQDARELSQAEFQVLSLLPTNADRYHYYHVENRAWLRTSLKAYNERKKVEMPPKLEPIDNTHSNETGSKNSNTDLKLGMAVMVRIRDKRCKYRVAKEMVKDEHVYEPGTVKFLGVINKKLLAGIEMNIELVEPYGNIYGSRELFQCPSYRGYIAHAENVFPKEVFHARDDKKMNNSYNNEAFLAGENKEKTRQEKIGKKENQEKSYDLEKVAGLEGTRKPLYSEINIEHKLPKENGKNESLNNYNIEHSSRQMITSDQHYNSSSTTYTKEHYKSPNSHFVVADRNDASYINDNSSNFCFTNNSTRINKSHITDPPLHTAVPPLHIAVPPSLQGEASYYYKSNTWNDSGCSYSRENATNEQDNSMFKEFEAADLYGDNDTKDMSNHLISQVTRVNSDILIKEANPATDSTFSVGSTVQLYIKDKVFYGLIRWIGEMGYPPQKLAGLELEDEESFGTDGTFGKFKYFNCPPKRGFYIQLSKLMKDARFDDVTSNTVKSPRLALETTVVSVKDFCPPITNLVDFIGRDKGIQGQQNSCYMDSTLFAMFACTDVFDYILTRSASENDVPNYADVQKILREQIVYPLRKNGHVSCENIGRLRAFLETAKYSEGGYLQAEKDPEEFVNLLFGNVLKMEPFIKLRSEANKSVFTSHLHQIFITNDNENPLPNTQYLLERSFFEAQLFLDEMPDIMIVHMPRYGKEKVYHKLQVTSSIDVQPILLNVGHSCIICNEAATVYCRDCSCKFGHDKVFAYMCERCWKITHSHPARLQHNKKIVINEKYQGYESERIQMELFAVVCIELSHYVSYVRCGEDGKESWLFFDSMSDRVGTENGYNIPSTTELPELKEYLSAPPLRISNLVKDPKKPSYITRLFEDAYLCFYRKSKLKDSDEY